MRSLTDLLKPGDVLLYTGTGFFSWAIRMKTWSPVSHTETYLGGGLSAASRDRIGVDTYPLREAGLLHILRPRVPFDVQAGLEWHEACRGQGYDTFGLLRAFFTPKGRGNIGKQWCSEHTARMAKKMGYLPFGDFDSEKVAPADFLKATCYQSIPLPVDDELEAPDQ